MPDPTPGQSDDDSPGGVPPLPEANPAPDKGHDSPPQGATQDDTPTKIYPTDPTGTDPRD